ncbi:hypothetical protein V6N13_064506 [Hibiscus sabdariffa]
MQSCLGCALYRSSAVCSPIQEHCAHKKTFPMDPPPSPWLCLNTDDAIVTDRTLGAMSSAPKGALAATSISQEVQHATSTHGAARDAICSLLGLHPGFRPGPPLGAPEASTTDMATGSPSQCTSF